MKAKSDGPLNSLLGNMKAFLIMYAAGEYDDYREYMHAVVLVPKDTDCEKLEEEFGNLYNEYKEKFPKTLSMGKGCKKIHFYQQIFKEWLIEQGYHSVKINDYVSCE